MAFDQLNTGAVTSASQIPFYDPNTGSDARASLAEFAEVLQGLVTAPGDFQTQRSAPNATGFNAAIAPPAAGASVWLLLTPAAAYAAGTITLPALSECMDGQEVLVSCTQTVTTLAIAGNGATVNGAPSTIAANGFFRLRFDAVFAAWYRVG